MNFNGATVLTNKALTPPYFFFGSNGELLGEDGEILSLLQKKFNFSIQWYNGPMEYGSKPETGGEWTGFIGALMNGTFLLATCFNITLEAVRYF